MPRRNAIRRTKGGKKKGTRRKFTKKIKRRSVPSSKARFGIRHDWKGVVSRIRERPEIKYIDAALPPIYPHGIRDVAGGFAYDFQKISPDYFIFNRGIAYNQMIGDQIYGLDMEVQYEVWTPDINFDWSVATIPRPNFLPQDCKRRLRQTIVRAREETIIPSTVSNWPDFIIYGMMAPWDHKKWEVISDRYFSADMSANRNPGISFNTTSVIENGCHAKRTMVHEKYPWKGPIKTRGQGSTAINIPRPMYVCWVHDGSEGQPGGGLTPTMSNWGVFNMRMRFRYRDD